MINKSINDKIIQHPILINVQKDLSLKNVSECTSINANNPYIRFFSQAVLDIPINPYRVPMAHFSHT